MTSTAITTTTTTTAKNAVDAPLEKLDDLLDRADKHKLNVIVTLFDFRTDYSLLLWPQSDRHLETLLKHYQTNHAILAWDLKNEPDLDYKAGNKEIINAWLIHTAQLARQYDPYHLLTVGWSNTTAALTAPASISDFISFHFYAPTRELATNFDKLRQVFPQKPIALTEFGLATWNSFFFPGGHSETEQAEYYANLLTALRPTDSAGYTAWTLYDFNYVPSNVAGGLPWQNSPQKELGIVKTDGKLKPTAQLLAADATLDVAHVPGWARFLKPFWLTLSIVTITFVVLLVRWRHFLWRKLRGRWVKERL